MCANTELHQLMQLPVLIHHYLEHKDKNKKETISGFLNEHYRSGSSHCANEHRDHEHLPFKTADCSASHHASVYYVHQNFRCNVNIVLASQKIPVSNTLFSSGDYPDKIWQPPKLG